MAYENLKYELLTDKIGLVTIAREKALNALNCATLKELSRLIMEAEKPGGPGIIIITGAGEKAFVAGADIAEMCSMGASEAAGFSRLGHEQVFSRMEASPLIFIAAVNGFALGGGLELAMACDMIFASEKARFGSPEVKLGLIPGFGGTWRLQKLVGITKAKEMLVTGNMLGAEEALKLGLVNAVIPAEQLMAEVRKVAETIVKNSMNAVRTIKRLLNRNASTLGGLSLELESQAFGNLFGTQDASEGMKAFLEKRVPDFKSGVVCGKG